MNLLVDDLDIESMLPHGNDFVWVDRVVEADELTICCQSKPLVGSGVLRMLNRPRPGGQEFTGQENSRHTSLLLEYAAQVAAVHGALLAGTQSSSSEMYVGAVKKVEFLRDDFIVAEPMTAVLHIQVANQQGSIYDFDVEQSGNRLVAGRLVLIAQD